MSAEPIAHGRTLARDERESGVQGVAPDAESATNAPAESHAVHVYDGIEEQDNTLPRWWLWILYGSIVFSVGYWFHYQVLESGESPAQRYEREMAADRAAAAERAREMGAMTPEALLTLSRDGRTVSEGRGVFESNCVACHGANGAGTIGPNLTDAFWLHGGGPDRIFRTVMEGVTTRGMPAWGPQLGTRRVQSVVAYLLTLKNTNVSGRPPQGEREP